MSIELHIMFIGSFLVLLVLNIWLNARTRKRNAEMDCQTEVWEEARAMLEAGDARAALEHLDRARQHGAN